MALKLDAKRTVAQGRFGQLHLLVLAQVTKLRHWRRTFLACDFPIRPHGFDRAYPHLALSRLQRFHLAGSTVSALLTLGKANFGEVQAAQVIVDPLHERGHILEGHTRCPALALS